MRVALRALKSNDAPAIDDRATLTYREAYPQTDSLQIAMVGRTEEFLRLRSAKAPTRFEYEITAVEGVKQVSIRARAVRFEDARGRGVEISAPWVVDARGRRSIEAAHWVLGPEEANQGRSRRLTLVLDPQGLAYPLVIDPGFTAVGSMTTPRDSHTATLLLDGRVLVAGGFTTEGQTNACEIYDLSTESWSDLSSPEGYLHDARSSHTATLLPNGKVLVTGGVSGATYLGTVELFDPATESWTTKASMNVARAFHTATLLSDGKVLVAGGLVSPTAATKTIEIYDPGANTWSPANQMSSVRAGHTATLLPSGKVLVAGGTPDGTIPLDSAEVYTEGVGWSATVDLPKVGRFYHSATLLPSGKVLIAGGTPDGAEPLPDSVIFNPDDGTWTVTSNHLTDARLWHTASLLPNGDVMVAGGSSNGEDFVAIQSYELFDPDTGMWTYSLTQLMTYARQLQTATILPNGKVLVAGGYDGVQDVEVAVAEIYDPGPVTPYDGGRPVWASVNPILPTTICLGTDSLLASGTNFLGLSECSGGNGSQNSSTNYPLLEVTDSALKVTYLPVDPDVGWTATSFQSAVVNGIAPGPATVRMIANGIPTINSQAIIINAAPSAFTVTGGGAYCSGGSGVAVGLSGSVTGVNYQLYNSSSPVGSAVAGTGSALDFGNQTAAGTYTVGATIGPTGCTATMTGSATVTVTSPAMFSVTGGGAYCSGGAGVVVGLSGSETGVNYQLYNGASPVGSAAVGTGSALDFGNQTASGTYTVVATDTSGCTIPMTGNATVTVTPITPSPTITGASSNACPSLSVLLTTETSMSSYQWYLNASPIGGANSSTYTASSSGTYAVSYSNGCGTGTSAGHGVTISVCLPPPEIAPGDTPSTAMQWADAQTLTWPSNAAATAGYRVYRGVLEDLPNLVTSAADSCRRATTANAAATTASNLTEDPSVLLTGQLYWYLVTGYNGLEGTAGNATDGPRIVNSTGTCP